MLVGPAQSQPSFFLSWCHLPSAHVPDDGGASLESGKELGAVGRECEHRGSIVGGFEREHRLACLGVVQADLVLALSPLSLRHVRGRDRLAVGCQGKRAGSAVGIADSAPERTGLDVPNADPSSEGRGHRAAVGAERGGRRTSGLPGRAACCCSGVRPSARNRRCSWPVSTLKRITLPSFRAASNQIGFASNCKRGRVHVVPGLRSRLGSSSAAGPSRPRSRRGNCRGRRPTSVHQVPSRRAGTSPEGILASTSPVAAS